MKKIIVSVIAFGLLIVSTVFAFTPFASRYITAYDTFLVDKGSGKIEIWFDVTGTTRMDEIGAQKIELKEKRDDGWKTVATYNYTDVEHSHILTTNKTIYSDYVEYFGTVGKEYYAIVTVWASKSGSGDSRKIDSQAIILE